MSRRSRRRAVMNFRCNPDHLEERRLLSYVEAAPASRINQIAEGGQFAPFVAARPGGEATMVWMDNGLDSSGYGVYARRIDALGQPSGNQFRVNGRFEGDQSMPKIGSDAAGNTLVVWQDVAPGTNHLGLYLQRYDPQGAKIGENTFLPGTVDLVNDYALLVEPGGEFSIAATSQVATPQGSVGAYSIRQFDATGAPTGGFDNSVDRPGWSHSYSGEMGPGVRKVGDTYLLTWAEWRSVQVPDVGTRNEGRAWVRRLDARGNSVGPDILLRSIDDDVHNGSPYMAPAVVPLSDGGFLATWYEYVTYSTTAYARRFDAAGQPQGSRITVAFIDHGGYGFGHSVNVAELGNGNLLTTWVNEVAFEADQAVFRVLKPDGTPITAITPIASATAYYQSAMEITPLGGPDFLLSWGDSEGLSSGEVYAQKFVDRTTIQLAAATATVSEGAGQVAVTVTRTGDLSQPASVEINTLDETATPGFDYRTTSVLVEFEAGQAERTIFVPILDDATGEGPETFRVQLGAVAGVGNYAGDLLGMRVTILDDDTGGGGGGGGGSGSGGGSGGGGGGSGSGGGSSGGGGGGSGGGGNVQPIPTVSVQGAAALRKKGKFQGIRVRFAGTLDEASAEAAASYVLQMILKKKGKTRLVDVPIRGAVYTAGQVTIQPARKLKAGRYQLQILSSPAGGLRDPAGAAIVNGGATFSLKV